MMEIHEVKKRAKELKEEIEQSLNKFRGITGYVPGITIDTKVKRTNDANFVSQTVQITLTIE